VWKEAKLMRLPDEWMSEPILPEAIYPLIRQELREWWQNHGRQYHWRTSGDSYAIFLAEVVLQKTQVAKAERAYNDLLSDKLLVH
jgi:adenine-specific DNA glycosylase